VITRPRGKAFRAITRPRDLTHSPEPIRRNETASSPVTDTNPNY